MLLLLILRMLKRKSDKGSLGSAHQFLRTFKKWFSLPVSVSVCMEHGSRRACEYFVKTMFEIEKH